MELTIEIYVVSLQPTPTRQKQTNLSNIYVYKL